METSGQRGKQIASICSLFIYVSYINANIYIRVNLLTKTHRTRRYLACLYRCRRLPGSKNSLKMPL